MSYSARAIRDMQNKGPMVQCIRTGYWVHLADTNSDGKGGRILKQYDVLDKSIPFEKTPPQE
jgi:hypothetical protein